MPAFLCEKISMDKGDIYQTHNFGKLQVVEYLNCYEVCVRFIDTGFETVTTAQNIRNGTNIRDKLLPKVCGIGFTGDGKYGGYKDKKAYSCWEGMLYTHITVCDEWRNFQNFAAWYYDNYIEGLQLHKDKIYSPETCCFSPRVVLTGKSYTFENTAGRQETATNRAAFCRAEGLDPSAITRLVKGKQKTHKGWRFIE